MNQDPSGPLPDGYHKVRAEKVSRKTTFEPDPYMYPKESQQIAVKVLDDLLVELFNMHIIKPLVSTQKYWAVNKGNEVKKNRSSAKRLNLPINLPKAPRKAI